MWLALAAITLAAAIGFCVLALAASSGSSFRLVWAAPQFEGEPPVSRQRTAVQTVDRIDYWIRRHVFQSCVGAHPSQTKLNPAHERCVWLSAIGQSLKNQYDALAAPVPPHLVALVKQIENAGTG
jgi:hypothetical protein